MFGRVPKNAAPFLGTRPNMSESHSEISTRVPSSYMVSWVAGYRATLGPRYHYKGIPLPLEGITLPPL